MREGELLKVCYSPRRQIWYLDKGLRWVPVEVVVRLIGKGIVEQAGQPDTYRLSASWAETAAVEFKPYVIPKLDYHRGHNVDGGDDCMDSR